MSNVADKLSDVVIVKGPPGSGKGFLSSRYVSDNPYTQHISAGNLVRGIRSGDIESEHTATVLSCLDTKSYLPDEVFGGIVLEGMTKDPANIELTLIDGFPHNFGDLDFVQEMLRDSGKKILGAVCLEATFETCVSRMAYRGMRQGEDVRRNAIFSATESEREYYAERYAYYIETRDAVLDMLMCRGIQLELVDTNADILLEEHRQIVQRLFAEGIDKLKANNAREV